MESTDGDGQTRNKKQNRGGCCPRTKIKFVLSWGVNARRERGERYRFVTSEMGREQGGGKKKYP